jgi:hypothetical protein
MKSPPEKKEFTTPIFGIGSLGNASVRVYCPLFGDGVQGLPFILKKKFTEIHGKKQEMGFWVFSGKTRKNTDWILVFTQKFKNHYYFVMKLSYAE